eukprot:1380805-Amorphochlora_amoeboformis.AAC.1
MGQEKTIEKKALHKEMDVRERERLQRGHWGGCRSRVRECHRVREVTRILGLSRFRPSMEIHICHPSHCSNFAIVWRGEIKELPKE